MLVRAVRLCNDLPREGVAALQEFKTLQANVAQEESWG